jgi:hypothetical protein
MDLISDYRRITRDLGATLTAQARRPDIKREGEYYLKRIVQIKSAEEFVSDTRVFNYAMAAFGLKDMTYGKAFIRKVLAEGVDSPRAFAMQLADSRFRNFAETFNFARYGKTATAFERTQQGTVDRYIRYRVEEEAGQKDERLRLALHFERKAPDIATAFGILADKAVYTVVRTALGLPNAISSNDIDKQAALISARLNIDDFKDPKKLDRLITRFMAMSIASGDSFAGGQAAPAISLLQPPASSIGVTTLLSIQSMRSFKG